MAKTIWEMLNGKTRFGKMTVLGEAETRIGKVSKIRMAKCVCDCGNERDCQPAKLMRGDFQSCGCDRSRLLSESIKKHGLYQHPLYHTWNGMHQRCGNPKCSGYPLYGGRGISVCERWTGHHGLVNFLTDMGERPKGASIDRIDPNGNYEPSNVRWATSKQQGNNKRESKFITFNGETMTETEWAEKLGIGKTCLNERLRKGWSIERALTTPMAPRKHRKPA